MLWANALRRELSVRGQQIAVVTGSLHELTNAETPSVIFGRNENQRHGNFYPASYRNICANPEWARRLAKVHTGSRRASPRANWRWKELDCANSSDALLMNIFCCRRHLTNSTLCCMLGVPSGLTPQFGFRLQIPLRSGRTDRTEIDLKLGDLLVVLCDARRPDLIERWYSVMRAVKNCVLRCRLQLLTWQELAGVMPASLRKFLALKYGITPVKT
jgi:restriction endonuclease-like protein